MSKSPLLPSRQSGTGRLLERPDGVALRERVRVEQGPLEGACGWVLGTKTNRRLVVAIDGLPRGVYVIVSDEVVARIDSPPQ
jgi:hypothetical protein